MILAAEDCDFPNSPVAMETSSQAPKRMGRGDHQIIPDMLWLVFLRLPLKSLFVCKSVCKSFYAVATNPVFSAEYCRSSRLAPSGKLAVAGFYYGISDMSPVPFIAYPGNSTLTTKEMTFSFYPGPNSLRCSHSLTAPYYQNRIIGSSAGILLCSGFKLDPQCDHLPRFGYYVLNPLTKDWRGLPYAPTVRQSLTGSAVGFVFQEPDPSVMGSSKYYYEVVMIHMTHTSSVVETYSSRYHQWSVVSIPGELEPSQFWSRLRPIISVRGVFYWLSHHTAEFLSYDPATCKINRSPLPVRHSSSSSCLEVSTNGELALYKLDGHGFDMWVKNDCGDRQHRWQKNRRIAWNEIDILLQRRSFVVLKVPWHWKVYALQGDSEKVLIQRNEEVFLYDLGSEKLEIMLPGRFSSDIYCWVYHLPSWHFQL